MALEQQQQAEQQVVLHEDAPPAPVDVDIDAGTAVDVTESAPPAKKTEQQQAPAKQPLPRPQARIQTLTHERDSERAAADRLRQELAEARREAAEAKVARESAERAGMENHVVAAKSNVLAAKAALLAAKEANDPTAEVEAQEKLARAAAAAEDADAWVAANPKPTQEQRREQPQREQPQQRQQEIQPVSSAVRDFMSENAWFSAVQMGDDGRPVRAQDGRMISNPEYDPDLHDIALMENKRIMREVERGSLPKNYIESPEYFARIKQRVQSEFPDAFEAEEEHEAQPQRSKTPTMAAPKQPVAPSTRQTPGAPAPKKGETMRLSGEQAELVRSLVDSGTMIYPRDHSDAAKAGKKMTYADACVKYANEIKNNPPQQQQ